MCAKLRFTEREYWESSYSKVNYVVERYWDELREIYGDIQQHNSPVKEITSMNQIAGW